MKPVILSALMLVCIAFGVALVPVCERLDRVFYPPRVPAPASSVGAGRVMTVYGCDAGACCCAPFADGLTASGVPAVGRICAADPSIPFGTRLWIEGIGEYVVRDRGSAVKGDRLDILFSTHAEAKEWGVQYLMVKEIR